MAKDFNDILVGFWEIVTSLLSNVKNIFVTDNKLNIFGFILLVILIVSLIEVSINTITGGEEDNDN